MLKISIRIALRHLLKEKFFTLTNLMGLATALAASLFIVQFALTEYSYDKEVPDLERKYRLTVNLNDGGDQQKYATNYYPAAPALKNAIPEIVDYNRFYYLDRHAIVTVGSEKYNEKDVLFADPNFFDFFGYPVRARSDNSYPAKGAYLSQAMAVKYFGDVEPLNQLIKVNTEDGEHLFKVSGVFDQAPGLSHLSPQIVLPLARLTTSPSYRQRDWIWNFFGTYLEFDGDIEPASAEAKINKVVAGLVPERLAEKDISIGLQPVSGIHLDPGLTYEYANVGSGLITRYLLYAVIFILVLAYVNYINITNARNILRTNEIGVRKVLGAGKFNIGLQLLMEAFIVNSAAIFLCLTLVQLLVPVLKFFGVAFEFNLFAHALYLPGILLLLLGGTVMTGMLPTWFMSKVKAKEAVTKVVSLNKSGLGLRRIMVVGQFTITLVMITSAIIMKLQLSYMINKDKGLNLEQVVVINGPRASETSLQANNYQLILNELNSIPGVSSASVSTSVPGIWMGNNSISNASGLTDAIPTQAYRVSPGYFTCYGIGLEAGRVFTENPADEETVLINESAFYRLGLRDFEEVLNQKIRVGNREKRVVGIVSDYHHFNLREPVYPTVLLPFRRNPEYFSFKLGSSENIEVLSRVEAVWAGFYPADPFDYFYQDSLFQRAHAFEAKVVQVFSLFTFLAIFIACLGLVGLATFITNRKVKEIGIRKVLGAKVNSLLYLLIKDFLVLIGFALFMGIPAIYYGMTNWLNNYAFRIDFPWWVVPVAAVQLVLITLLAVGYQTIKTALADPVRSLRYE